MLKTTFIIVMAALCLEFNLKAQEPIEPPPLKNQAIMGKVIAATTGEALPGAVIKITNTSHPILTNDRGEFSLALPNGTYSLSVKYLSHKAKTINIQVPLKEQLIISLEPDDKNLQEVEINAGYYTVKERERTGNITKVTASTIGKQPVLNPLQALQGRVPGVEVTQQSGVPGGGISVKIRGTNSLINGNDPLYILNGVQVPSASLSSFTVGGIIVPQASPLSSINPSDIESIEVLKDADATAIYGSRGANGVVLITTKKGRAGALSINANFYQGTGNVTRKMELLNTKEYIEMRKEAYANDKTTPSASAYDVNGAWDQERYTDWQEELFGGTANTSNGQLSLSGGNENTTFLLSGNYYRESTVYPGDKNYQRKATSLNVNHVSANQRLKISGTTSYNLEVSRLPTGNLGVQMLLPPNAPALLTPEGTINWENGTFLSNPLALLYRPFKADVGTLTINSNFSYLILLGLEFTGRVGYTRMRRDEIRTAPLSARYQDGTLNANSRTANYADNWNETLNLEPQLSYSRKLGKGTISLLTGTTIQDNRLHRQTLQGTGFVSDGLMENISAATTMTAVLNEALNSQYRYLSVYGRINYNLDQKYFVNLTARKDGSSRFGPENRYANFGAIGTAWIFTEETFIADNFKFLSFGKLRASYGITGSDQIGDYRYLDNWTTSTAYQGSPSLVSNRLFNPDYGWETTKKAEVSLALGFLKNKFNLTTTYFRNRSSDQIVASPLPANVGFTSISENLPAIVQNSGLELELAVNPIEKENFSWSVNINLSVPKNKLYSFPGIEKTTYNTKYIVGESLSIVKLLQANGVDPKTGILSFVDFDGNGGISTPGDLRVLKNMDQKYSGGFQSVVNFKNWELDFLFQFVKQPGVVGITSTAPGGMTNQPVHVLNRWREPGDVTPIQKYTASLNSLPYLYAISFGEDGIGDASFIRLKNLSLAYNIPSDKLKGIGLKQAKITLQAQNLVTITNYLGLDPESRGFNLPPLRMVTAGFQITF
ncbi:SusC/RagA family TonB-linked outer membrane protein [Pedobacter heparinus]|uniref:SusC/RagA family TonB-linked outer membrane protein n=1 Tax=Pedobacter heparinus TaxID=984 RepID=UPI00293042BF|nr:SusC/RagA family TonB-linked outer membrane protein [Pedobacter heparinus]